VSTLEERYKESPELITSVDSEQSQLNLEFTLVLVDKENITLMMNENGCYLSAPSEDVDYAATVSFLYPVNPAEAKAIFQDGILIVKIPFKEALQNHVKVPIE
jgi:HSP20 family molecular chaperone IbpA